MFRITCLGRFGFTSSRPTAKGLIILEYKINIYYLYNLEEMFKSLKIFKLFYLDGSSPP